MRTLTLVCLIVAAGSLAARVAPPTPGGAPKPPSPRLQKLQQLLDDFGYVDPRGVLWPAPKGSIIDGASIPQVLWSVVGSPYTGEYRDASVVHDVACTKRDRPWQDVHRMFYEACRAGGVGEQKAKLMYAAVYHFGPKWAPGGTSMFLLRTMPVEEGVAQVKTFVESGNPSLEEIEKFAPSPSPERPTRPPG